jgi:tetratricopeptide (TPR) repeat protein
LSEVYSHPYSARANYAVATQIVERTYQKGAGNEEAYRLARSHLLSAVELDHTNKSGLLGLMYLECTAHKQVDQRALDEVQKRMAGGRFTLADQTMVDGMSDVLVEGALCLTDEQAQELLSTALSNPNADSRMRGLLYTVAMNLAIARKKSLPEALQHAKSALEADPSSVAFRVNLSYLYLRSGQLAKAREEAQYISQNPIPRRTKLQVKELWRAIGEVEN